MDGVRDILIQGVLSFPLVSTAIVLFAVTVMVPVALVVPQPPVNGIE